MSRATLWHQPPFGPGHFRLQNLSFSAHEQFFLTARHTEPARKLLMTTGRCSCEGMVPGPCLSSCCESLRVDSYAVSIRSLKSYSDHIYVDLKITFLKRNKNKLHRNLLRIVEGNLLGFLYLPLHGIRYSEMWTMKKHDFQINVNMVRIRFELAD